MDWEFWVLLCALFGLSLQVRLLKARVEEVYDDLREEVEGEGEQG